MKSAHRFLFIFSLIGCLGLSARGQDSAPPTPPPDPFTAEAEAGTVNVSGNSDSQSYATKGKAAYALGADTYTASGHYIQIQANGIESALNWDTGIRYDRAINNYLGAFLGYKAESDVYAGYTQRDSTDIGAKYFLAKEQTWDWTLEIGYRYAKTQPRVGTPLYESFGRAYTEVNKSFDKTYTLKYWVEYLPNITSQQGYQINSEASGNIMLTSIFSLKLAYLIQYLNVPPAPTGKHSTTTTTMNLVAKF
jgi:putative salt-induced outer membrane protein